MFNLILKLPTIGPLPKARLISSVRFLRLEIKDLNEPQSYRKIESRINILHPFVSFHFMSCQGKLGFRTVYVNGEGFS